MKLIKLKASINKNNKQVSFYLPKNKMDSKLKRLLKDKPNNLKSLNLRIEGYDEW